MYNKFEKLLVDNNISVSVVSRDTGIASSTLSEWKTGKYKPKADKLLILAKYFNVPMEYFMEE